MTNELREQLAAAIARLRKETQDDATKQDLAMLLRAFDALAVDLTQLLIWYTNLLSASSKAIFFAKRLIGTRHVAKKGRAFVLADALDELDAAVQEYESTDEPAKATQKAPEPASDTAIEIPFEKAKEIPFLQPKTNKQNE